MEEMIVRVLNERHLRNLYSLNIIESWLAPNGHAFIVARSNILWARLITEWKYQDGVEISGAQTTQARSLHLSSGGPCHCESSL